MPVLYQIRRCDGISPSLPMSIWWQLSVFFPCVIAGFTCNKVIASVNSHAHHVPIYTYQYTREQNRLDARLLLLLVENENKKPSAGSSIWVQRKNHLASCSKPRAAAARGEAGISFFIYSCHDSRGVFLFSGPDISYRGGWVCVLTLLELHAVPFCGKITQIISRLSPKRDCNLPLKGDDEVTHKNVFAIPIDACFNNFVRGFYNNRIHLCFQGIAFFYDCIFPEDS